MILWTAYAFISGIVAVPFLHNNAVGYWRQDFFGGGILALGIVAIVDNLVGNMPFPMSYSAIFAIASVLMFLSSGVFTAMGEPEAQATTAKPGFFQYLKDGVQVFRTDRKFATFVYVQWCGGAVIMAMPFYVVQASQSGFDLDRVALLLGAQTVGALVSNPLWGWWGDSLGKESLLKVIALGRIFPPMVILILGISSFPDTASVFSIFIAIFFVTGALANGLTIAVIGFLMEISPEDQRPAYSGYFNAITAPAFLLPLLAGIIAMYFGVSIVFTISAIAAALQFVLLAFIRKRLHSPA